MRLPAAMTGNAGLKFTKDRWSCEGIVPLSFTFDTPGILARSMARCRISNLRWSVSGYATRSATGQPGALHIRGLLRVKSRDPDRPRARAYVCTTPESYRNSAD